MTVRQPIKFIQSALTKSTLCFSCEKTSKQLYEELKSILDKSDKIFASPNLSGQITADFIFEITHKREALAINIGGFAGMNSEISGQIVENGSGTKIIATIKPNTFFLLAFIGFFTGGLFSLLGSLFFYSKGDNSIEISAFCLLLACPLIVFQSYTAKKSLINTFMVTLKLTKEQSYEK